MAQLNFHLAPLLAGIGYGIAFPAWTVAGIEGNIDAQYHGLAGGMLTTALKKLAQQLGWPWVLPSVSPR